MPRSRLELIISVLETIPKYARTTRRSLKSDLNLGGYLSESIVELLVKRGFVESSGSFKEHERNYLKLTYDGFQWLEKFKSLMNQLEESTAK